MVAITVHPDLATFDRLKTRIQGLRAKTTENGCTEAEALSAAAKVAELLDRYDLSLPMSRSGMHNASSARMRPGTESAFRWMIVWRRRELLRLPRLA